MNLEDLQLRIEARLPAYLRQQRPEITLYPDEAVVILTLGAEVAGTSEAEQRQHEQLTIAQQREATRALRMQIADEVQALLQRPVAWGMRLGASEVLFTTRSTPVMTRLGRAERDVLDTLVAAGLAETRSSALAYTVRAFATEHAEWLDEVRQAIAQVRQVRERLKMRPRRGAPEV